MDRELTEWERGVIEALVAVGGPGSDKIEESLPHLVVTGGCGCGCASFFVRDRREVGGSQEPGLEHFANGWTPDKTVGQALLLDGDGQPFSVDVESDDHDARPDPKSFTVERA